MSSDDTPVMTLSEIRRELQQLEIKYGVSSQDFYGWAQSESITHPPGCRQHGLVHGADRIRWLAYWEALQASSDSVDEGV